MPASNPIYAAPAGPPLPSHLENGRPNRAPEERWANEGGSTPPAAVAAAIAAEPAPAAAPIAAPSPPAVRHKQPHDTVEGCRNLASDDLARAADADTVQGRLKLEHSAATWTERGDMLQSLTTRRDRREAAAPPL